MKSKSIGTFAFVLGIIIIVCTGTTYAYYLSSNTSSNVRGNADNFSVRLSSSPIYVSNKMIPIKDNLVKSFISKSSNKCKDRNNYDVCSLYKLTLSNNGKSEVLNAYIKSTNSTYTTNNLKAQLYDSNNNPVTDILTITGTTPIYFKKTGSNFNINMHNVNQIYNLVVWLHDTNTFQEADEGKSFSGEFAFVSTNGDETYIKFNA